MTRRAWLAPIALAALTAAGDPAQPVVAIDTGALRGVAAAGVEAFKGIPYAAPPVGALRWRPPAPAAKWQGVRAATAYGAACPQPDDHKEPWARVGATSEDCLFLNVWRPAGAGAARPVMVFLHGGGFTYGAAGVPLYDGANLARRGVVVVTLNYRLGRLGFFAHPLLTREAPDAPLGNYGIMDQIAALQWVQRNAAAFGGDPGNVTLFGESAGAGVVQLLMGSPAAKGLFHKAISESGSGGSVLFPIRGKLVSAENAIRLIFAKAGIRVRTTDELRALPVERLLGRSFPFIDGKVVTASPGTPFLRGTEDRLPLLIGANSNEATLAINAEPLAKKALGSRYKAFLAAYEAARPRAAAGAARTDLAEDALSVLPSVSIAAMHAVNGAPAWSYLFDQVPANRRAGSAGTPHGGEIEYLFGNPDEGSDWDAEDRRVSDAIANRWVRFARTGDPNGGDGPRWPRVDAGGTPHYLVIGTPMRTAQLSPLQEEVRQTSLAASSSRWRKER